MANITLTKDELFRIQELSTKLGDAVNRTDAIRCALDLLEFIMIVQEAHQNEAKSSETERCANCGEPWDTARRHLSIGDGEWVCSLWCEDIHEQEGCPLEQSEGETERRRARRLLCQEPGIASYLGTKESLEKDPTQPKIN